jgi:hypothetical protein
MLEEGFILLQSDWGARMNFLEGDWESEREDLVKSSQCCASTVASVVFSRKIFIDTTSPGTDGIEALKYPTVNIFLTLLFGNGNGGG